MCVACSYHTIHLRLRLLHRVYQGIQNPMAEKTKDKKGVRQGRCYSWVMRVCMIREYKLFWRKHRTVPCTSTCKRAYIGLWMSNDDCVVRYPHCVRKSIPTTALQHYSTTVHDLPRFWYIFQGTDWCIPYHRHDTRYGWADVAGWYRY